MSKKPKKDLILTELKRDTEFLKKLGINDYSLLAGVHSKTDKQAKELELNPNFNELNDFRNDSNSSVGARRNSSISVLKTEENLPPYVDYDDGGINSINGEEIYFMGVIDILTQFDWRKKLEYVGKTIYTCSQKFSCVPPENYQKRFMRFVGSVMKEDEIMMMKD